MISGAVQTTRLRRMPSILDGLKLVVSPELTCSTPIDLSPQREVLATNGFNPGASEESPWGLAMNFDGASTKISSSVKVSGNDQTTAFAIAKVDTLGDRKIFSAGYGLSNGQAFAFTVESVLSSNRLLFRHGGGNIRYGSGLSSWFTMSATIPHGATTTDDVVVWINGRPEAGTRNSGSDQTLAINSTYGFTIGSNSWATGSLFDGRIGLVALWDRELSAAELGWLHGNPLAIFQRMRMPLGFYPIVSSGVSITVASCTHSHTADAPAVTQTHQITAADATHSQTADSPAVTQTHVVAVAEATHAHAADSPAVTQTHVVAAADATHGHTADAPAITQTHVVSPVDATHGHTADNVTVAVGGITVTPADSDHGHTADQPAITQTHVIVVSEATHGHTADSPAISQTHVIAVASALHSHTADNVTVSLSAAVAASQFWVCVGLEGWFSDRVGIEGWLAEALGLEEYLATAKGIE